jgi:hypothetical protein
MNMGELMTMFREQLRESSETMFGVLFSGSFMLLWLCCWPFYRLYRSHTIRG